jgi:hypothetical protein
LQSTNAVALINDSVLKELRVQSSSPLDYFPSLRSASYSLQGAETSIKVI